MRRVGIAVIGILLASSLLSGCFGLPHAQAVITGLDFPGAFTLDPNNHEIWYAERFNGEIHRRDLTTNQDTLVYTVSNLITAGEQGLLGIALHPNFPASQFVYAYASRNISGNRNQILKITLSGGVGVSEQVLIDDPGITTIHNGGRIKFGPDGNLYAVIGEHSNPANSQTINGNTNLAGKVLRMTPDGAVPGDNPIAGSFIYAFGIRNSYGFSFDPANNNLWLDDNGPSCNDEVDLIIAGGNYAWGPEQTCVQPPPNPQNTNQSGPLPRILPKKFYPAMGITGSAFCSSCGLASGFNGKLLLSTVNDGKFHMLTLNAARDTVTSDVVVYDHPSGVLSLETRPGQPIFFSDATSIYRLAPPNP
jgi:glucose/arabinose dehydrogenase